MNRTVTMVTLLAATVAMGHAQAQTEAWIEVEDESLMVEELGMTVGELEDSDVYGATGEEIAEIDDVLIDPSTDVFAVELDVGGFLGLGEKNVAVPLDALTATDGGFTISMTEEELEAMPEYDD